MLNLHCFYNYVLFLVTKAYILIVKFNYCEPVTQTKEETNHPQYFRKLYLLVKLDANIYSELIIQSIFNNN